MATQPIDKFCADIDPNVKDALTTASVGSTVAREKCLNQAFPEPNKTLRLRELANAIKSTNLADNLELAVASLEKNGIKVLFAKDAAEVRKTDSVPTV